jgi:hypothetical protein
MPEQANAVTAIDDLVARRGQKARGAAAHPAMAPRPSREQRLDVSIFYPEWRVESTNNVRQTCPRNRL